MLHEIGHALRLNGIERRLRKAGGSARPIGLECLPVGTCIYKGDRRPPLDPSKSNIGRYLIPFSGETAQRTCTNPLEHFLYQRTVQIKKLDTAGSSDALRFQQTTIA